MKTGNQQLTWTNINLKGELILFLLLLTNNFTSFT